MKRILAYGAIYFLWGASFLAIRIVVHALPPFFAAGTRFAIAGAVLLAYSLWRRLTQPQETEWRNLILLGIILFFGNYSLLFWAEQKLESGLAAVIAATIPAQVFLLEWLWLRRVKLTATTLLGLLLGLGGVTGLMLPPDFLHGHFGLDRYAVMGLLGSTCWAVGTVVSTQMKLPKARPVNAGWQMLLGGASLLAVSAATGEWNRVHIAAVTWPVFASLFYLTVFASVIAFSAYVYLLAHEPVRRVSSYAYVNPVTALLLGIWLGGESLSVRQGIACAIVIAGVFVTLLGREAAVRQVEA